MKFSVVAPILALLVSFQVKAALGVPKNCTAPLLVNYSQKVLDQASAKSGESRKALLLNALIKIRGVCATGDDGEALSEYFPEKINSGVETALGVIDRYPGWDGNLIVSALSDVRKLAKNYLQNSKLSGQCGLSLKTTSSVTALYSDRFHENFIGYLKGGAKLQNLHPHLLRSNLSGSVLYVKVLSNSKGRDNRRLEGESGYISATDTNWKTSDCL